MSEPLVTIITPLFNGANFIERAVRSVQRQSFSNWQHLVINDHSTDGGDEIARRLAQEDPRIEVLETIARGAPQTRNTGIEAAAGRYIAFLDCDDYWSPEKLETQLAHMQAFNIAFCWSSYFVVDAAGNISRIQTAKENVTKSDIASHKTVIGCLTAVYDRHLLGRMFMPEIRMRQDLCLFWSILQRCEELGVHAQGLALPLAFHQLHSNNMTRNKMIAAGYQWRAYRHIMKLPFHIAMYNFVQYALNSLIHRSRKT